MQPNYSKALSASYPQLKTWSMRKLKKELKDIENFLDDENSSTGRQDTYWCHALANEIDLRN